jgi:hypothetical protein
MREGVQPLSSLLLGPTPSVPCRLQRPAIAGTCAGVALGSREIDPDPGLPIRHAALKQAAGHWPEFGPALLENAVGGTGRSTKILFFGTYPVAQDDRQPKCRD